MPWRVHEVKQVGLLPTVLHDHGQRGALEAYLAADLVPPVVRPLVLTIQVPALAGRRLMRLLDNHVAQESLPAMQVPANAH